MSNSPLVTATNLTRHSRSRGGAKIDTITIHCIVGQWTAKQGVDFFASTDRPCSSNYIVGKDGSIGLSVEECNRSICTSSVSNDSRAVTIEVASDTSHPYAITDNALSALIKLCADICKRNGIEKLLWEGDPSLIGNVARQNMTAHRWFAAKACPGVYIYHLLPHITVETNKLLNPNMEDEDMKLETFRGLYNEMRSTLQDNDAGTWSKEEREWAESVGLVKGSGTTEDGEPNMMWEDLLTREQMVVLMKRQNDLLMEEISLLKAKLGVA